MRINQAALVLQFEAKLYFVGVQAFDSPAFLWKSQQIKWSQNGRCGRGVACLPDDVLSFVLVRQIVYFWKELGNSSSLRLISRRNTLWRLYLHLKPWNLFNLVLKNYTKHVLDSGKSCCEDATLASIVKPVNCSSLNWQKLYRFSFGSTALFECHTFVCCSPNSL